jgi:tetratricopeptide (TPR) repeat protein
VAVLVAGSLMGSPYLLTRRHIWEADLYQRDYLMRQIELAAQALGRILRIAAGGNREEALGLFDEAYQPLLGVSGRVVSTLTEEQLLGLLTAGATPDLRRVAKVLEVLEVEADLYEATGRPAAAAARRRRALALAGFLAARSETLLDAGLAARLAGHAAELELPAAARLQLARVLEALGRYAGAEDAVFEAIDADPDDPDLLDAGIAFYRRLLPLEPERLAAGGLPLDEVNASIAELLRRAPVPDEVEPPPSW